MRRKKHLLEKGDAIKLTKSGREKVKKYIDVVVLSSDVHIIRNIKFAVGGRKYLVRLSIKGKDVDLYLSDVRLAV